MGIYYVVWGIVSILSLIEVSIFQKKEHRTFLYVGIIWLLWTIFVLLVGFKGNVGTDYKAYQRLYEATFSEGYYLTTTPVEPLFWLWMKLFSCISLSFPTFWLVTALFNISLKIYIIRYLSPFVSISILIYIVGLFFERDFDGIRQGLSIGLCYLACILYLKRKKAIVYNSVIVCAVLMHYTSIIFFCLPLLAKINVKKEIIYLCLLVGFGGVLYKFDFLSLVFSVIGTNNFLYGRLYNYLNSDIYSQSVGINLGLIFRIVILLLFMKYEAAMNIDKKVYNLLKNGFFLSLCFSLLFNHFEILSHRLAYGFREFQIFIIPYFVIAAKGIGNKIFVTSLIILYSFVLLTRLLSTPHLIDSYIYKTIFG